MDRQEPEYPGDEPHPAEVIDGLLEHKDDQPVALPDMLDSFVRKVGQVASWFNALLLVVIVTQVLLRCVFSNGQTWLEELQWHFYAAAMLFGLSYALVNDSHVRVDILYDRFSSRGKRIIEIISIVFLLGPFVFVVFVHSLPFVADAWRVMEGSDSAGGLPYRFIIKSMIPIGFGLLALAAASRLIRDLYLLWHRS